MSARSVTSAGVLEIELHGAPLGGGRPGDVEVGPTRRCRRNGEHAKYLEY